MNRRIVRRASFPSVSSLDEIDLAAEASVLVTSETSLYPIDNVFDAQRGPGGSCWMASDPGEQTVLVKFDKPRVVRTVSIEVEERANTSTQHVEVSTSRDDGKTFEGLAPRNLTFTPYGATFAEETWLVPVDPVTHVRLRITPGPRTQSGRPNEGRASLTSLVLR